jgi:transcriptional regulator with XRE-family HTH domain
LHKVFGKKELIFVTIAQRIYSILEERNISQSQLARGTGISQRTISDWRLKGTTPSADKIPILCSYFSVSTDWLLTGEHEKSGSTNIASSVSGRAVVQQGNNSSITMRNNGEQILSSEILELIRIYESLNVKSRHILMAEAFKLEEKK